MYTNSILAATGALLSVVAAIPMAEQHRHHHVHNKREYVWVTHVEAVIKTIPVTKTVWVEPGEAPPAEKTPEVKQPAVYNTPANSPPAAYTPPSSPEAPAPYVATSSSSSTSVYVAPTPTSVYTPPPAPPAPTTPTTTAAPATYAAPAPASSSAAPASYGGGSSSGGSGLSSGMGKSGTSYTGDFTWYEVGMGACGKTNVASDHIVAISHVIFDSYSTGNPNTNPLCGKELTLTGKNGSPFKATIADRCPGCDEGSLDLSQDFFNLVTDHGDGRVGGMKWSFD